MRKIRRCINRWDNNRYYYSRIGTLYNKPDKVYSRNKI